MKPPTSLAILGSLCLQNCSLKPVRELPGASSERQFASVALRNVFREKYVARMQQIAASATLVLDLLELLIPLWHHQGPPWSALLMQLGLINDQLVILQGQDSEGWWFCDGGMFRSLATAKGPSCAPSTPGLPLPWSSNWVMMSLTSPRIHCS